MHRLLKRAGRATFRWLLSRDAVSRELEDRFFSFLPPPPAPPPGFLPGKRLAFSPADRTAASPIVVTSRFRSGSTLLWNCFRDLEDVTAYYEPLNPRKWFDAAARGNRLDKTHRGVTDYWREYDRFHQTEIPWCDDWPQRDLYLSPSVVRHELARYFQILIESATGRAVLQFNRLDFRLHWFRRNFPDAFLVHLFRNPRDQWISTFVRGKPVSRDATVREFAPHDEFYLLPWARDLRRWFPVLAECDGLHPYGLSYLIWRLSFEYARNLVDLSIGYEELVQAPAKTLSRVAETAHCAGVALTDSIPPMDARSVNRWQGYADADWFREIERRIDRMLDVSIFAPPERQGPGGGAEAHVDELEAAATPQ